MFTRVPDPVRWVAFIGCLGSPAALSLAATFSVTTTADSGAGSLRQAILDANGSPGGTDTIAFAIPGAGVHTIAVPTALPVITDFVLIDGYTQPGSSPNTDPNADNAVILIELSGSGTDGLVVSGAGGGEIHGLALYGFATAIHTSASMLIAGNFIGLNAAGGATAGNALGVWCDGTPVNIGHPSSPGARNVISGNVVGVKVETSAGISYLRNNLVGTDPAGTTAIANGTGIVITTSLLLGGHTLPERNVISGNTGNGVEMNGSGTVAEGNFIGLDATGFAPLGNGGSGIVGGGSIVGNYISANGLHGIDFGSASGGASSNFIGLNLFGLGDLGNGGAGIHGVSGQVDATGNWIAHNEAGIWMESPSFPYSFRVHGNKIFENGGLGIVDGPILAIHPNGAGLPFPIITSVVPGATTTTINGFFDGAASRPVNIELFSSPACSKKRPSQFDEGETKIGSLDTATNAAGHVDFSAEVPVVIADEVITANVEVYYCFPCVAGSEGGFEQWWTSGPFSQRLPYSISPASGSPAGGDAVIVAGTNFEPGATLTIGGVGAGNVNVVSPTEIDATAPGLAAGAAYDVTVVNPDGSHGTIPIAWLVDFVDVPPSHIFHDYVRALLTNGIAMGVGGASFGVDASTLRQQMAVFLLKAKHGICYTPPPCAGIFADVPCPSLFADWIEALAAEGITGGCGGGNYCPAGAVRRDQMAAFLLKAEHGSAYVPPPCAGLFADVPCPSLFADWIEQLAAEQVTGGCGGGDYCPQADNTRGQMAVFFTKTFGLQ